MEYNYLVAELNYFSMQKDWGQVLSLIEKHKNKEYHINLFKGLAYFHLNKYQDGIESLTLDAPKDYSLATLYLKRELYNANGNYDLANEVCSNEYDLLENSSEFSWYVAFEICLNLNLDKETFDLLGKLQYNFRGLMARGYYETVQKEKTASNHFLKAKELKPKDINNILGWINIYSKQKKNNDIYMLLEELENNDSNVSSLLCFNIEKLKILWINNNYNSYLNILKPLLEQEKNCLILYKFDLLYNLVYLGNYDWVIENLENLKIIFERFNNINLQINILKFIVRLCGRNITILSYTLKIWEGWNKNNQGNISIMLELANNYLLLNFTSKAEKLYKSISEIEDVNESWLKLIEISVLSGNIAEAESQIEFFKEAMSENPTDLIFLNSIIQCRKGKIAKENNNVIFNNSIKLFDKAIKNHIEKCKELNENFEFYITLNPDFILNLCKEIIDEYDFYITLLKDQSNNGIIPINLLIKISRIIKIIINKITGLITGRLLYTKCLILLKDFSQAAYECKEILKKDEKNDEAFILLAMIYLWENNYEKSLKVISDAFSFNFNIMNNPIFALIKAECEINLNNLEEAEKTLNKIEKNNKLINNSSIVKKELKIFKFDDAVQGEIKVNLSKLYMLKGDSEKSKEVIEDAIIDFGTDDNARGIIQLGSSEIYRINGEIKKSIEILQNFNENEKLYIISQKKLANIYLNELKHRRNYALILKNLTTKFPSLENYENLGDSYLFINEPYEALEAYKSALDISNSNEDILIKFGNALVSSHNYKAAEDFYESKIYDEGEKIIIKTEYIKLLEKLKYYKKIELITGFKFDIKAIDENLKTLSDKKALKYKNFKEYFALAQQLEIISSIFYSKIIEILKDNYLENNLKEVKEFYLKLLDITYNKYLNSKDKAKKEGSNLKIIKNKLSNMNILYFNYYFIFDISFKKCKDYLGESLKYDPYNLNLITIVTEKYFLIGDYSKARELSKKVLKSNKKSLIGLKVFMDCLINGDNLDACIKGFEKIWNGDNNNFSALSCLICSYRAKGKLFLIEPIIQKLEEKLKKFEDPGFNYAKGLYYYFIKDPSQAINNLIKSKNSYEYRYFSIILLIEIYLNPEQELFYSKFLLKEKFKKLNENNIISLKKLIKELNTEEYFYDILIYNSIIEVLMNEKLNENKNLLDKLFEKLKFKSSITSYFSMICLLKQKSNNLKNNWINLSSLKYTSYFGLDEYFDKSLITCADFLFDKNKIDNSKNKIEKVISQNKSSFLAHQFNILIKEKQKVEVYEDLLFLWKSSNKNDLDIGYKLGLSLVKNSLFEKAIEVGNILLKIDNSKNIREKIMCPARNGIRGEA